MADSAEMIRLMRHTADLLDACDPKINAELLAAYVSPLDARYVTRRALAESAAAGMASTVLRMVAACLVDNDNAPTPEPVTGDGTFDPAALYAALDRHRDVLVPTDMPISALAWWRLPEERHAA